MKRTTIAALLTAALLAACGEAASKVLLPDSHLAASAGVIDPTATWKIPVDDAALSLRRDRQFTSADGFSVYADGVCRVSAKIFATTAYSNTGDATIDITSPKGNSCGRRFHLIYPDGATDFFDSFSNLNALQSTTSRIAIRTTEPRRLIIGTVPRCGRVIFGDNGRVGEGTDKLNVTRLDGHTWHVQSGVVGSDRALCESTGAIYNLQVNFDVVASRDLP